MHEPNTYLPCNPYLLSYDYNRNNDNNDEGLLHLLGGQRELTKAIYDSENDVRTNLDSVTSLISNGNSQITANVTTVSRDVLNAQQGISKDISDVRRELSVINNNITQQIGYVLLESQKTASKTNEELLKGFASTQLDACKNTAELARQLAECCCETKQLFSLAENNRLRDQIANLERNCNNNNLELTIRNVINNSNTLRA
jgi:hypothetical protein